MAGNVKGACHERGLLQALRRYGSCEEWKCAWLSTLSLPLVRLQFHNAPPRGKPPAMKALALLLYAMGNVSFGSIARILGVSDVAVLNWVRDEARKLPEPSIPRSIRVAAKKGRPCYASLIPNERLRNWRLLNKSLLN
jgi:hypothetical protein